MVSRPELLHLWFPGIVACSVEGTPARSPRERDGAPRDAAHQRRAAATLPVPHRRRDLRRAPGDHRRLGSTSDRASSSTAATPTRRRWPSSSAAPPGAPSRSSPASSKPARARRSTPSTHLDRRSPPDGPQDPLHHHRPAALRHPRLQRGRAQPHAGRRPARRATGIRYERAVPQSVVCMPSRSTMLTGQHPSTHGVWMNGVALPVDAPSVAAVLHEAGYRTALVGKPHFEPFLDPFGRFTENGSPSGLPTAQTRGTTARRAPPRLRPPRVRHPHPDREPPLRPLDGGAPRSPSAASTPCSTRTSRSTPTAAATPVRPQVKVNPVAAEWYHTDWVADRTIAWLDGLASRSAATA